MAVATSKTNSLVAVSGYFTGALEIGGQAIQAAPGDSNAFVAVFALDQVDGVISPRWLRRIGHEGQHRARALTFDKDDNVIAAGDYAGEDASLGLRPTPNGGCAFAIKYDPVGELLWSRSWGDQGEHVARAVGADGSGFVYVAGNYGGLAELPTGTLKSAGGNDMFVLKLAP
jgi:hypothetical protein